MTVLQRYFYVNITFNLLATIFVGLLDVLKKHGSLKKAVLKYYVSAVIYHSTLTGSTPVSDIIICVYYQNYGTQ